MRLSYQLLISLLLPFIWLSHSAFSQESLTSEYKIKSTPTEILGLEQAQKNNAYIDVDQNLTYAIYLPNGYNPSKPAGIMVFAGVNRKPNPPFNWVSAIRESNLILVEARASGSEASYRQRELLAEMAVSLVSQKHIIDKNRIYITGEGRVASVVAMNNPDVFKGAIYTNGNLWTDNAETKLDAIKQNRFVFLTTERKIPAKGTSAVFYKYQKAGIENTKLMLLIRPRDPKVRRTDLIQAINYLDNPGDGNS